MKVDAFPLARLRLAQIGSHLVVALIALVVIGGATRVMEAGLACPDWPLCFGTILPSRQMNIKVFLEWFHRLDAFFIGIAMIVQFITSLIWRSALPRWLPKLYFLFVVLIILQGLLGALTVLNLLPSGIVTAHLGLALSLVAVMSALTQWLLNPNSAQAPVWWRPISSFALFSLLFQSLIGGRIASTWSVQLCSSQQLHCQSFLLHRAFAIPITISLFALVGTALLSGGWPRSQWPFLISVSFLVLIQIAIGSATFSFNLSKPLLTISHQLIASLLIALLAAISFRSPPNSSKQLSEINTQKSFLETCHG